MTTLCGRTMFISGASRGIGLAIAKRAAANGANVALMAKTDQPHLTRDPGECTANAFLDDEVPAEAGTTDLSTYAYEDGTDLQLDVFVDDWGAFEVRPKPATA
jgi:NAD(P)-dependent dehydrogenase (short-subunit alcohol dehydrogenase family)